MKYIKSPKIGSIVKHTGFRQDSDIYPCDVYITGGCYLDSSYGRLSNFWSWKRILQNGNLGKEEHGYGSFIESDKKFTTYKYKQKPQS